MSDDRVDTSRPEYSWIPFFEELAQRLADPDISDSNGAKLVELLEKMQEEAAPVPTSLLNHGQSVLDPFTFLSMLNYTQIRADKFDVLCKHLKNNLEINSEIPPNDFYRPQLQPIAGLWFFDRETNATEDIRKHWKLFDYVVRHQSEFEIDSHRKLIDLIHSSVDVNKVGISKLSMALYWIAPHEFLHVNTINGMLQLTGSETVNESPDIVAESYVSKLAVVKTIDTRPGPILNDLVYLVEWEPPSESVKRYVEEERRVWFVHSRKGEHTDLVVENGYIGLGWDHADLVGWQSREDVKRVLKASQTETNERKIGQEAGSIMRFLSEMKPGDLVMTPTIDRRYHCGLIRGEPTYNNDDGLPFLTRRAVDWQPNGPFDGDFLPSSVRARQQTVNELKGDEATAALKHYDGLTVSESRVWSVKSNGGANAMSVVENGYSGVGWAFPGLPTCRNFDDVKRQFPTDDPEYTPARIGNEAGSLRRFLFEISIGDYVLTSTDDGGFYHGVVTGPATFGNDDGLHYATRRLVDWRRDDVRRKDELPANVWQPSQTVTELKGENRLAFLHLINEPMPDRIYDIDTMLEEGVFLERDKIERILAQLKRKQNLILQGPPGTGKTFLARKLAYALMGERADERILSVQFHQSYAYEDFVGGYRPDVNDDDQLVFKARDGAFLRLCRKAREAPPEDKFVMLIDEINRGNLSRVFGELLMLIEADKRSAEHAVELQHAIEDAPVDDGRFFVPPNVYIIGTMNLADRSLTGMNVAMRRRFAFAELRPKFGSVLARWLEDNAKMPKWLRDLINDRMVALNDAIANDPSLDRQQAIGHSFFCQVPDSQPLTDNDWLAWYKDVVEFQIRPQLEEYWFDAPDRAKREAENLTNGMPFGDAVDTAYAADAESEELIDD